MISEQTKQQLADLKFPTDRPLVICDVDEVIVHFIRDFEDYIATHNLAITPGDPTRHYVVKHQTTDEHIPHDRVFELINSFFAERTKFMQPIMGAAEGLNQLGQFASVVLLTNLPHFAGDDRRANMKELGLDFPVITNSGPKGPAISELASRTDKPVIFIDDSQNFIQSAYDHAPHVHLVHFLHDDRFAPHVPELDFVSLRCDTWDSVVEHAHQLLRA